MTHGPYRSAARSKRATPMPTLRRQLREVKPQTFPWGIVVPAIAVGLLFLFTAFMIGNGIGWHEGFHTGTNEPYCHPERR